MFALTPLDDPALTLPLVLTTTAINNAERTFCVQVDGDDVQPVTWAKFMEDVKSVAAHLKQVVETVPSKDGPPAIALLANGEYVYALNTIAIIMNGWIVRRSLIASTVHALMVCARAGSAFVIANEPRRHIEPVAHFARMSFVDGSSIIGHCEGFDGTGERLEPCRSFAFIDQRLGTIDFFVSGCTRTLHAHFWVFRYANICLYIPDRPYESQASRGWFRGPIDSVWLRRRPQAANITC